MQVEPSTRFANRALDSGERFLRRRPLYPTELRAHIRFNPRQGRPNTFRLGGGPSILLRYGTMFSKSLFYKAFEDSVIHHRGVWEWFLLIRKVDF